MSNGSGHPAGEILRLRNLAMIENIRRAEDPASHERLERQQVLARLGRLFGGSANPLEAMHEHAHTLQAMLAETPLPRRRPDTGLPRSGM
jgi:hypothetical protein